MIVGNVKVLRIGLSSKLIFFARFLNTFNISRHCLPYFKKSQNHELSTGPDDAFRGHEGPLKVSQGKCKNPLHQAFMEAGKQHAIGYTDDMNGYRQEGCGPMDMTIHNGIRQSTSRAYLHPACLRIYIQMINNQIV